MALTLISALASVHLDRRGGNGYRTRGEAVLDAVPLSPGGWHICDLESGPLIRLGRPDGSQCLLHS